MKIKTMRERLHEAIDLANDEKIIAEFRSTPLEISRSKHLTLSQIRDLIKNAEGEFNDASSDDEIAAMLKNAHRTFFAIIKKKGGSSEPAAPAV